MSAKRPTSGLIAKSKVSDLERVRNNQRRCRARRKDYVAQFEDTVRQYESAEVSASTDPQLQRLFRENESLKRLLHSLGLGPEFLAAYNEAARTASSVSRTVMGEEDCCQAGGCGPSPASLDDMQFASFLTTTSEVQAPNPPPLSGTDAGNMDADDLPYFNSSIQEDAMISWPHLFEFPKSPTSTLDVSSSQIQPQSPCRSNGNSDHPEAFHNALSEEGTADATTPCSLAFLLVLKSNPKGYSATELDLRLRVGYRRGATRSEGCRVDNTILINVLADIS